MSRDTFARREPEDSLVYLLKHATAGLHAVADEALAPLGIDGKELGALRVLVGREPASQLEVAQTLGVDRTTMVALLDGLEKKGVVTRRQDPADRRRNVVELTQAGLDLYAKAVVAYAAAEDEFLSPASAAEVRTLRKVLRAVVVR
ncbi:MarR family winged helix-turn-helix transcriptional regulator [Luteimicrobium sp. DT211]|uniref:MarR family winged helix-turn-helix transcriptional regulator n=1 Tax=Luteimicrobium sp. DT211 TaxID=3393412 RepID=UPI003CFA7C12